MNIIVCVDDKGGLSFNHRRQSRDRVLNEKLLVLSTGSKLWMAPSSEKLFAGAPQVCVAEDFLTKAGAEDFCFVEQGALTPYLEKIHRLYLVRWNRVYPADCWLDLDLTAWQLESSEEFPGSSHEKITLEVYKR